MSHKRADKLLNVRLKWRGETFCAQVATREEAVQWKREKMRELNRESAQNGPNEAQRQTLPVLTSSENPPDQINPRHENENLTITPAASLLDCAIDYALRGINIFSVHSIKTDGRCTCGNPLCERPAKHPKTEHGLKDATTDVKQIQQWFRQGRSANVGAATGEDSGFFTVDVDGWFGNYSLVTLESNHAPLPLSWEHETGRGFQIHFAYPKGIEIRNSTGKIGRGLDIRGEGGYGIWPPSRHYTGRTYRWTHSPEETELAEAPEWLIKLIVEPAKTATGGQAATAGRGNLALVLDGVPEGQRDDMIYRYACRCIAKGITRAEITTLVLQSARNCTPPYPEKDSLVKIESAFRTHRKNSPEKATGDDIEAARQTVRSLITSPKEIRQRAFEPSTVNALALVREEYPAEWVEFKKHAPGIVKDVERAIRKASLHAVSQDDSITPQAIEAIFHNLGVQPPSDSGNLILPDRYIFDSEGLGKLSVAKEGQPVREAVSPDYVLITQRHEDVTTNDCYFTVQRHTSQGWKKLTSSRGDFMDASRLVRLSDKGISVWSGSSKTLAGYFFHFEAVNADRLPVEKISSACGWIDSTNGATFLWGRKHLTPTGTDLVSFRGQDAGDEQIADGYHSAGTYDRWVQAVSAVSMFPRPVLNLHASFAAPFLKIFDVPNIGVDNSGQTSSGKTSELRLAASPWGRPDEEAHNSCVHTWDLTKVAVERLCATGCDMPVILDDTKRGNPKQIGPALYSVISGHGRGRGSLKGLAQTRTWRTVLISSGEAAAVSYTEDAGVRSRVLTIKGYPFGRDDQQTRSLVDQLNAGIRYNYGHAGPRLVEWLIENRSRWGEFKERYQQRAQSYDANSGVLARLADIAAAITTAGEIAHEALSLPWAFIDPFETLWPQIRAEAADVHVATRALRDIYSWAISNQDRFYGHHRLDGDGKPKPPMGGWAGKWERKEDWTYIGFLSPVLKRTLVEMKYDPGAVLSDWKASGCMADDLVKRIDGKNVKLKILFREDIDQVVGPAEDDFEDSDDQKPPKSSAEVARK